MYRPISHPTPLESSSPAFKRDSHGIAMASAPGPGATPKGVLNSYPAWNDDSGVSKGVSTIRR